MNLKEYKKTIQKPLRKATLCFPVKENKILLAMKKRGFGINKWNGVGGKVSKDETVEEATIRETKEEIGVEIKSLKHVATLDFYTPHKPEWDQQVVVYFSYSWVGDPEESEEVRPKWYEKSDLPFSQMWPDDAHWLPPVLDGNKVKGEFLFNEDGLISDFNLKIL